MVEVQRHLGLRNRDVTIINPLNKINVNQRSSRNTDKTIPEKDETDTNHIEVQKEKYIWGKSLQK